MLGVCWQSEPSDQHRRNGTTYSDTYCRYFLKMFLWVKNGERVQTSESLTVRALETLNSGSTNENVDQLQRSTLSSGIVNLLEGSFRVGCSSTQRHFRTKDKETHLRRPRNIWARPILSQRVCPRRPNEAAEHAKLKRTQTERDIPCALALPQNLKHEVIARRGHARHEEGQEEVRGRHRRPGEDARERERLEVQRRRPSAQCRSPGAERAASGDANAVHVCVCDMMCTHPCEKRYPGADAARPVGDLLLIREHGEPSDALHGGPDDEDARLPWSSVERARNGRFDVGEGEKVAEWPRKLACSVLHGLGVSYTGEELKGNSEECRAGRQDGRDKAVELGIAGERYG